MQAEFNLKQCISVLERTPETLNKFLRGLDDVWLFNNEGENTWSPHEVIGHLIHCEKTDWMPRVHKILSGEKTFDPFDRFGHQQYIKGKSTSDLLDEFAAMRRMRLDELNKLNLTEQDFVKTGIHPEFGEVTLHQLLATWVAHDFTHISQIVRVMAFWLRDAVGPWKNYMTIYKTI